MIKKKITKSFIYCTHCFSFNRQLKRLFSFGGGKSRIFCWV